MRITKLFIAIVLSLLVFTSCNKYTKVLKSKDYEYKLKMADLYFEQKNTKTLNSYMKSCFRYTKEM